MIHDVDGPLPWPRGVSHSTRAFVESVCTPAEVEVVKLKAWGYGYRKGSVVLGCSVSAMRNRWRRAQEKLLAEQCRLAEKSDTVCKSDQIAA